MSIPNTLPVRTEPRGAQAPLGPEPTPERSRGAIDSPERITLAIDGRAASDAALRWTVRRAATRRAEVLVVSIVPRRRLLSERAVRSLEVDAERLLCHARARLRSVVDDRAITTAIVSSDSPMEAILDAADPRDLLVLGTDNATRTPIFHHPSMAVRVAAVASSDVVVVPAGWRADAGSGVVVGVHGEGGDHRTLDTGIAEARITATSLSLVHSWDQPSLASFAAFGPVDVESFVETRRRILCRIAEETRSEHPDVTVRALLSTERPSRALLDAARRAELLVVGAHARRTVDRFVLGSTSHDVLADPVCPTLVVHSVL
jgi:nucleotide-binding universal stress UspA family protein